MRINKKYLVVILSISLLIVCVFHLFSKQQLKPKNIILFIGDGMGTKHLEAASWYKTGKKNGLFMQQLDFSGSVNSIGSDNNIPDSANSMSQLATGIKLPYGVLGLDGKKKLETVAQKLKRQGKSIGFVTNASITDATPASFFAHQKNRRFYDEIYAELLDFKPQVILGGPAYHSKQTLRNLAQIKKIGYTIARSKKELLSAPLNKPLYGEFHWEAYSKNLTKGFYVNMPWILNHFPNLYKGLQKTTLSQILFPYTLDTSSIPTLIDMTKKALSILEKNKNGYFLMIESALIDKSAHLGFKNNMIAETLIFNDLIKTITNQVGDETLIIVTADHECGGVRLSEPFQKGIVPTVTFSKISSFIKSNTIKNKTLKQVKHLYNSQNKPLTLSQQQTLNHFQYYTHTKNFFSIFAKGPGAKQIKKMSHISELHQLF